MRFVEERKCNVVIHCGSELALAQGITLATGLRSTPSWLRFGLRQNRISTNIFANRPFQEISVIECLHSAG